MTSIASWLRDRSASKWSREYVLAQARKPPIINIYVDGSALNIEELTNRVYAQLLRKTRRNGAVGIK